MPARSSQRPSVFLVRVWLENGSVLARITHTLDITRRDETTVTVAGADEIEARLHSWLQSFIESVTRQ